MTTQDALDYITAVRAAVKAVPGCPGVKVKLSFHGEDDEAHRAVAEAVDWINGTLRH